MGVRGLVKPIFPCKLSQITGSRCTVLYYLKHPSLMSENNLIYIYIYRLDIQPSSSATTSAAAAGRTQTGRKIRYKAGEAQT